MNDNYDDVFSERKRDGEETEAKAEEEVVREGFKDSPFDTDKEETKDTTYHFVGDPYKEKEEEKEQDSVKSGSDFYSNYTGDENINNQNPVNNQSTFNPYAPNSGTQNRSYNSYYGDNYSENISPEEPKKKKGLRAVLAVIVVFLAVAVGLVVGTLSEKSKNSSNVPNTTQASDNLASKNENEVVAPEISPTEKGSVDEVNSVWVSDKVRPSVVGVMVYSTGKLSGEGSGVLWMENDGYTYVITCAHVINESGVTYNVLLLDGNSYEAEKVGADTRTDIGVLRIKKTGLTLASFGDSSTLKIGEPIYAIGNPGGSEYFGSVTDGIISSIDRSVTSTYKMTCIQHNAAINPGNSGGALVNTAGQIVGINSSKIASTEFEGMGFAVPVSIAVPVAQNLVNYGYVPNRPKLGIEYAPVSAYQVYSMVVSIKGLPQGSLVIAGISPESTLKDTKAQVGDLIIAVNGKNMDDSSVLLDLIEKGAVGDELTLTLCRIESRTYKTTTFDVTISLVEDKGTTEQETTLPEENSGGYYYGGSNNFEDFFKEYFGW